MPGTAETETPEVAMETEVPESSPQGEASGVKVGPAECSPQEEVSATIDDPMGVAEEVKEEEVDFFKESAKKAAASAEAENEKALANMEEASDKKELVDTEGYKYFRDLIFYQEERGSPLRLLVEQQNGYATSGLYHTGIRDDPIQSFKVQHMVWRVQADAHPQQKYYLKEEHMFGYMCQMNPIYERRPSRNQVIFHSGDIRSTLNDSLMEKASAIKETELGGPGCSPRESKRAFRHRQPGYMRGAHECYVALFSRSRRR